MRHESLWNVMGTKFEAIDEERETNQWFILLHIQSLISDYHDEFCDETLWAALPFYLLSICTL